ncbi:MAG: cytochrome c biogenesis CcdA family protein [Oscillospiraceae bacterium]
MDYIILFLEGIITFISPCMLPMLPIYISYFAGSNIENKSKSTIKNAFGFVLGFTIVFVILGAFAGTIGRFLTSYSTIFNVISGGIMILFGLNFMEVIRIPLINQNKQIALKTKELGFFSSILFGIIFSIGWTPCVGTFLGSALILAASNGGSVKGILLLLSFSLGLGIPFMISAVLIDRLKSSFDFIKKHYKIINFISGIFLIIIGILMATGFMGYFLSLLTF